MTLHLILYNTYIHCVALSMLNRVLNVNYNINTVKHSYLLFLTNGWHALSCGM